MQKRACSAASTLSSYIQAEREMVCKTLPDGRVVWKHEKEVMRVNLNPNPNSNAKPKPNPPALILMSRPNLW